MSHAILNLRRRELNLQGFLNKLLWLNILLEHLDLRIRKDGSRKERKKKAGVVAGQGPIKKNFKRKKYEQKSKSKLSCYNCGKKGHFARDYAKPKKIQEKRTM